MLETDGKVLSRPTKRQILTVVLQNCQKSTVKHSLEKPMLLNFVYLSTMLCSRLWFLYDGIIGFKCNMQTHVAMKTL